MLWAVGSFGPNLPTPSYHALRVPLLNEELDYTKGLLKGHKEKWEKYGCSIMSDAWTDKRQRSNINFLVNSRAGTMFLKSIDASDYVKTGEKLFELLDDVVEEIGEHNVVQVVTDNGSNYVLAGKLLMEKRPNLFWTPCAAHCLDLMLEDIGKLPLIQKTIKRAISLVSFIYSHSSTLAMLRSFTNGKELVRHAVTRFATSFLSLERLYEEKGNLRRMRKCLPVHWKAPSPGWTKINVDAAFTHSSNSGTMAMIIRDSMGVIQGGAASTIKAHLCNARSYYLGRQYGDEEFL
ncbi:hypothetical protein AHAS_Ahas05G0001400 [Arachis hypogaea]